jgi:hypothetical protein
MITVPDSRMIFFYVKEKALQRTDCISCRAWQSARQVTRGIPSHLLASLFLTPQTNRARTGTGKPGHAGPPFGVALLLCGITGRQV